MTIAARNCIMTHEEALSTLFAPPPDMWKRCKEPISDPKLSSLIRQIYELAVPRELPGTDGIRQDIGCEITLASLLLAVSELDWSGEDLQTLACRFPSSYGTHLKESEYQAGLGAVVCSKIPTRIESLLSPISLDEIRTEQCSNFLGQCCWEGGRRRYGLDMMTAAKVTGILDRLSAEDLVRHLYWINRNQFNLWNPYFGTGETWAGESIGELLAQYSLRTEIRSRLSTIALVADDLRGASLTPGIYSFLLSHMLTLPNDQDVEWWNAELVRDKKHYTRSSLNYCAIIRLLMHKYGYLPLKQ